MEDDGSSILASLLYFDFSFGDSPTPTFHFSSRLASLAICPRSHFDFSRRFTLMQPSLFQQLSLLAAEPLWHLRGAYHGNDIAARFRTGHAAPESRRLTKIAFAPTPPLTAPARITDELFSEMPTAADNDDDSALLIIGRPRAVRRRAIITISARQGPQEREAFGIWHIYERR